jgi:hypothetical protein
MYRVDKNTVIICILYTILYYTVYCVTTFGPPCIYSFPSFNDYLTRLVLKNKSDCFVPWTVTCLEYKHTTCFSFQFWRILAVDYVWISSAIISMILGNEIYLSVRQMFYFCINCLFTRFYQLNIPACLTQRHIPVRSFWKPERREDKKITAMPMKWT